MNPNAASSLTPKGNTLQFFYNPELNLVVVDLIGASGSGGNELVRLTLDEDKLLAHCRPRRRKGARKCS